ncbi:hypothetical protein [Actinocrispum wychmicini]|uniref:CDP-glycerol:poly(Glycerophosphate) glycerophosphotransferase n=1 Tax=Actinocrispum wychmicini TaxID=1213861 RepID=A0A4R2JX78_9PSEU|nr:hypothetical protein [Actinocrispum wychmicini]TCO61936.1 hypothetical protein EV192_10273 [Actinocrispum wychmicini]
MRVPVGIHADRWSTIAAARNILFVTHTMASANRLMDLLDIFDSDHRVQIVHTCPDTAGIPAGVTEYFTDRGLVAIPWSQAVQTPWDLVITANTSGGLHDLHGPIIIISHGIGYTKNINRESGIGNRESGIGNRESGIGNRESGIGNRESVYGLSAESLISGGRVIADVLVLSHGEQLDRLATVLPSAVDHAVVAGDPRFDRILASLGERSRYRAALGVAQQDTLVVVSSTWWQRSLFGSWPDLLRQLLAELPVDRYRVAAVLHPHIWFGHGPAQVRSWLAACLRAGLILVPPQEGWAATLIAADVVVGDHGAVTTYGASINKPVLLATFPTDDVAEYTAVHALGAVAPLLDRDRSLLDQVDETIAGFVPARHQQLTALVSAVPGKSAATLRELCYRMLGLPEPFGPVPVPLLPLPDAAGTRGGMAARVSGTVRDDGVVHLSRHPADALIGRATARPRLVDAHLVAAADHPLPVVRGNADIIFRRGHDVQWLDDAFTWHPVSAMAALVPSDDICLIRMKDGRTVECRVAGQDPLIATSALYVWHSYRNGQTPDSLRVQTDAGPPHTLSITRRT